MVQPSSFPGPDALAKAFLDDSDMALNEQSRQQLDFIDTLRAWFDKIGIESTIAQLNAEGHSLAFFKKADGEWLIYREPLPDGKHELQISCIEDGSEIMVTTPMTDAAWEQMLQDRKRGLPPKEQAAELLRERFYARGGELYCTEDSAFEALTLSNQVLRALYVLDMEINNGGFSQYFSNTGGQHAEPSIDFLNEIGAEQTASLLSRAMDLIGSPKGTELSEKQMDALDQNEAALEALDDKYYAMEEDIALLVMQWIAVTDPAYES